MFNDSFEVKSQNPFSSNPSDGFLKTSSVLLEGGEQKRIAAATKIQSTWRGHLVRKETEKAKRHFLSHTLLEKAKSYIDPPSNLEDLPRITLGKSLFEQAIEIPYNLRDTPRASCGKTPVFLPKDSPIVLKLSGSPTNQKRFEQMKHAREICEQSGYEHLVIPRAHIYRNFIIESKLPLHAHSTKGQIGLYIENRKRFTPAVKEFVGFLCQSTFNDITGNRDPYGILCNTPVGRYDNIPLYIEEDQGKIGLIDLEQFHPGCDKSSKDWCFFKCRDAVHLFPLHLKEILSEAKKFDPKIKKYQRKLKEEQKEALKRFKIIEDHLNFINKKGITAQNPLKFEKLGLEKIEELKSNVERKLRKEHEKGWYFKGFLGEDPNVALTNFNEKTFPHLLEATYILINDNLESNKKKFEKATITSKAELISLRTFEFKMDYKFALSLNQHLSMFNLDHDKGEEIVHFTHILLDITLKEMEKASVIAYYNPNFGYGGYAKRCVFC